MAGDDDIESDSSELTKKNAENKSVRECICGAIAKTGITCTLCKIRYHKSCVNRIKSCCNVPLIVSNLKMATSPLEIASDTVNKHECEYSQDLITSLKDLIAELQLNKSLLIDKINSLQIENNDLKSRLNQNTISDFSYLNNTGNQNNIKFLTNNSQSVSTTNITDSLQPRESTDKSKNNSYAQVTKNRTNSNNAAAYLTPNNEETISNTNMNIKSQRTAGEILNNKKDVLNAPSTAGQNKMKKTIRGNAKWDDDNFSAGTRKAWLFGSRSIRDDNALLTYSCVDNALLMTTIIVFDRICLYRSSCTVGEPDHSVMRV
ncbi:hypothetical protein FQR65_LT18708 [Abscondita terminalis]|nr:hypothetical protein FQR65_LT18708 [Abscondita terminalis]